MKEGRLQKKSSTLRVWRDRYIVFVQKSNSESYYLYTFYSHELTQGASNKFSMWNFNFSVKASTKTKLFNKKHTFTLSFNNGKKKKDGTLIIEEKIKFAASCDQERDEWIKIFMQL